MQAMRFVPLAFILSQAFLLSQGGRVPAPASVFGFEPGTDDKLAGYEQVVDYLRKVDAGTSSRGRTFHFALVSSSANLARIDRYREIARRLAHPEGLDEAEARRLAREGRAFVHIDGGLHSTEIAGPQHIPQLLHRLLVRADEPEMKAVLDNVVLMLWPTINPDGHQMVADWYMKNVGTPQANAPLPGLYQEYVGHDNNRDAYMLNMIESRVLEHTWRQWEPQILHVHHQSAPFPTRIWLPPFAEPIATHAPPILSRQVNMIGMAIAKSLEERGQVGATHMGTGFDAWYPGYIDYLPIFKNIAAFWTETAGGNIAPRHSTLEDFPENMRDLRPQSLYASPWPPGTWRLRDQIEYMETASLAVLEFAAKYRESVLLNRYRAARDQIEKGRRAAPFAYFVPQAQRDPVAAVELLRRLAFGGVRVSQLTAPVVLGDESFPAGTWVVPADQEFAALAREVLDVQTYPDLREFPGGPPEQPYDAAGWTLPLAMGVRVVPVQTALSDQARAAMRPLGPPVVPRVTPSRYVNTSIEDASSFDSLPGLGFDSDPAAAAIVPPPGRISGSGARLALDPAQNNAFRAINRALGAGLDVQFRVDGPNGAQFLIAGLSEQDQDALAKSLALAAERTDATGASIGRPRLALFDAATSMDAGWTRWVLERYGFAYARVSGSDLEAGSLRDRFDVLLITDEPRGVLEGGGRGARGGGGGGRGRGQPQAPAPLSAGSQARVRAIDEFVRAGGTLVCLNRSSSFAIEHLALPVKNALAGLGRQQFFGAGSLLRVMTDPTHRVMAGMPVEAPVFFNASPAFEVLEGFRGAVLARYQDTGSPLLSGYLLGEAHLHGKAAALEVAHGSGRVVLIGFRPQWRGQPFGTFRVLFNAALFGEPRSKTTVSGPAGGRPPVR
jgi:hypothetical protein